MAGEWEVFQMCLRQWQDCRRDRMKELSNQRWEEWKVSSPSLRVCKQWLDTLGLEILIHGRK